MISAAKRAFFIVLSIAAFCPAAFAGDEVGRLVALRGKATIERAGATIEAKLKGELQSWDIVHTGAGSRAKLLFIDDSVLTVAENSKLVIQEFIYSKGKGGKSLFNLMDGKMRTVVGKTKFEVQTPTAVASARGTVIYFDVGVLNNEQFSKIICLEGNVQVRSSLPSVTGSVTLTPGTMVVISAGHPLPQPRPAPPAELRRAGNSNGQGSNQGNNNNDQGSNQGNLSGSGDGTRPSNPLLPGGPTQPPILPPLPNQQQLNQPKNINITITPPAL